MSANAVGRLVKVLEDWLGVTLFTRLPRGIVLTEAGRTYLAKLERLFDQLAEATIDLQRRKNASVLTISAAPSFAVRWLVPRLQYLTTRYPGLDVRLHASASHTDFTRDQVDLAIRQAIRIEDHLHSDLLVQEDFYPVCSPALLSCAPRLRQVSDLSQHTLLHSECSETPDQIDWTRWLAAAGEKDINAERGLRFSFSHLTLQAAGTGQGVALGSSALISDDLSIGRLVRPFGDLSVRGPYGLFIVCPLATADHDKIVAFRNWALEEAARERCAHDPSKSAEARA